MGDDGSSNNFNSDFIDQETEPAIITPNLQFSACDNKSLDYNLSLTYALVDHLPTDKYPSIDHSFSNISVDDYMRPSYYSDINEASSFINSQFGSPNGKPLSTPPPLAPPYICPKSTINIMPSTPSLSSMVGISNCAGNTGRHHSSSSFPMIVEKNELNHKRKSSPDETLSPYTPEKISAKESKYELTLTPSRIGYGMPFDVMPVYSNQEKNYQPSYEHEGHNSGGGVYFTTSNFIPTPIIQTKMSTSPIEDIDRKKQLRMAKNREAARECRRKKKDYIKCLENRVSFLEAQNKEMTTELRKYHEKYGPIE